jgi:TPR repeat protein
MTVLSAIGLLLARFGPMEPTSHPVIAASCALALAALCAFGSAAQAGPAEDVQQAEFAAGRGELSTAMSLFRRAADQNHPLAQARLADLLHAAEFDAEAMILYRKAAEQGEPAGEFGIGRMYRDGAGVPRDPALALEWFRKSEKKNHVPTLDALARAYRMGDLGLPRDIEQANALDSRVRSLLQARTGSAK